MSIPTVGEEYTKLLEYLRKAQESSAMLAHLRSAEGDSKGMMIGRGWLAISEALKAMQYKITQLAQGRLQ